MDTDDLQGTQGPGRSDDGDAALEARIVAWVLGEASAFEASELERLLAARPELALFKRRIEAVHGLLGEAAALRRQDPLRLDPARRTKLLAAFGVTSAAGDAPEPAVLESAPAKHRRRPWSPEWKALRLYFGTAAACVLVFFVISQFETTFSSRAVLRESSLPSAERMEEIRAEARFEFLQETELEHRKQALASDWADVPTPQVAELAYLSAPGAVTVPVNRSIGSARNAQLFDIASLDMPLASSDDSEPETVPEGDDDQRIVLDEFKVTATQDVGYTATSTLAGSRVRTDLHDIGSAVTANFASDASFADGSSGHAVSSYKSQREESAYQQSPADRDASHVWSAGFSDGAPAVARGDIALNVMTQESLRDTGATDNQTLLQYTANTEVAGAAGNYGTTPSSVRASDGLFEQHSATDVKYERDFGQSGPGTNLNQPLILADGSSSLSVTEMDREVAKRRVLAASARPAPKPAPPPAAAPVAPEPKGKDAAAADKKLARTPAPSAVPAAIDEAHAAKEPVSTFSLHVSDASFKLAQAALDRGQVPEPAQIRPEEFYNAFDYGDPAPTLGQKVACRIEQSAHPFLQQRNLVRVAMKVASSGRGAGQPLRLTVVLDTSGSMEREDRAASVARAMQVLASLLGPNDRVTLIGFARQPRLLAEALRGDEAAGLVDLVRRTPADGGTNLEEALKLADHLAQRHYESAAQNRIVLLTDGAANLGNADPAQLAARIEGLRGRGIAFDACGVGTDGLDDEILEALTRRGDGRYYVLDSPADADGGFARQLAGAFRPAAKNVKVQVRFNPARVGAYRLLGFEKHRLREEDFRNDRVDAAELAAEEAAVAVYQVEVLPQGEGELGEVFVRFRDMESGQMVERSWPIAHDPRPRAFEQASASLQLAGTASLLAEVLRGGALGDQVDLDALAPVVTRLKSHYAAQRRVQELATMFEQLRRRLGR